LVFYQAFNEVLRLIFKVKNHLSNTGQAVYRERKAIGPE
tara:strand:- start:136 stop:252 length:117 start_codon:yes stop_codon:yes gene_type:complete